METLLSPSTSRRSLNANSSSRPTWLLSTLSELEERMKILTMNPNTEDHQQLQENEGDTFAERAESYYRKRPQLLALLQDLYNSYVTLSDRYMQSNSKNTPVGKRHVFQGSMSTNDTEYESDVESSLSYQQPQKEQAQESQWASQDYDLVVAELVAKSVEVEVASDEAATWERRFNESARKAELQRSLLEVLESERVVLLNENARLEYQAASLAEENSALAAEAHFVRCRAAELARRAAARTREDQRVCQLSIRVEDLQGQIHSLEKRNQEQQQLGFQSCSGCSSSSFSSSSVSLKNELAEREGKSDDVAFEGCFKVIKNIEFSPMIRKLEFSSPMAMVSVADEKETKEKKSGLASFWGRVKKMDLFVCGAKSSSSSA